MEEIKKLLGGYNCGGCGYDDCECCSNAILSGEAPCDICPMIDDDNIEQIKKIVEQNNKKNN